MFSPSEDEQVQVPEDIIADYPAGPSIETSSSPLPVPATSMLLAPLRSSSRVPKKPR